LHGSNKYIIMADKGGALPILCQSSSGLFVSTRRSGYPGYTLVD